MANSVQKNLGYRNIIYNVRTEKFYTFMEGDNYEELDITLGSGEEGEETAPTTANVLLANPTTFSLEGAENLATQQDLNIYFADNIATKTSELTNDAGFITAADVPDVDVDAYTKAESDARYLAVNISSLPELPTV